MASLSPQDSTLLASPERLKKMIRGDHEKAADAWVSAQNERARLARRVAKAKKMLPNHYGADEFTRHFISYLSDTSIREDGISHSEDLVNFFTAVAAERLDLNEEMIRDNLLSVYRSGFYSFYPTETPCVAPYAAVWTRLDPPSIEIQWTPVRAYFIPTGFPLGVEQAKQLAQAVRVTRPIDSRPRMFWVQTCSDARGEFRFL